MIFLFITTALGAPGDLRSYSAEINKSLPENFDPVTRLRTTTVQNNNLYYHFLVKVSQEEFKEALPKVRGQILRTICSQSREKRGLKTYRANLVYQYENEKGQSLGEFMVRPEHCP